MRLLFSAGTARGGTNFRTLILNNHPQIRMSLDPFIPLFRFYRDSLLRSVGSEHLLKEIPSASILDDYYFSVSKLQIMKTVQSADPDIEFDMAQWDQLEAAIASRMTLASVDLIPHLHKLPAPTFREVFYNTMKVVAAPCDDAPTWVGFNDNWTAEFFPHIARLIPDAKFILHLRDPRAVVHSSEFAEPNPAMRPTVISFARHLRKLFALATMFQDSASLEGRLYISYYEPFVSDPVGQARHLTDFLGVGFFQNMVDVGRFLKADGCPWPSDWNDYQTSTDAWRQEMPREMAELTEFVCDPDMRLHCYRPEVYDEKRGLSQSAFSYAVRNSRECLGWRTDFREIERTLGCEFYRKYMLVLEGQPSLDEIERCFLFPIVFQKLKQLAD